MKLFTKLMAIMLLIVGYTFAQSNHTITIDGTINTSSGETWSNTYERFSTSSGSSVYGYITWDATNIYVAWPQVDFDGNNQAVYVVIDTDPTGSNGSTDLGYEQWFRGSTVTAPFNADYIFMAKEVSSALEKHVYSYSSSAWHKDGADGTTDLTGDMTIDYGNASGNNKDVEISIDRSAIGVGTAGDDIKIIVYCKDLDQNSGWGYLHRAIPDNSTTDGTGDKTFSHYYGYTLDSGYNPNNGNAYDYIMRKNSAYLSFDGSDDYVEYADDATLGRLNGATDYTIEAWVNIKSGASKGRIIHRNSLFSLFYDPTNDRLGFSVDDDGDETWYFFYTKDNTLSDDDQWHHVAVVRNTTPDPNEFKMYIDGSDQSSGTWSGYALRNESDRNLYIGNNGSSGDYFEGYVDEVRLKNDAETSLHSNKSDNAYMSDDNTAALFHFDEGTGHYTKNEASGTNARLGGTGDGDASEPTWETDVTALPLPVELTSFTADVNGNKVELNWSTATEVNNYGFEILRSSQNGDWENIGFVAGHGNSNSPKYYSYVDNSVDKGQYSYKLKQIDIDGKFEYSDVVSVNLGAVTKFALKQNYPNPFNPTTEISFDIPKESNVKLSVYNSLGQKVADLLNEKLSAGTHRVKFDGSNLSSGIYYYRMQSAGFINIKKMILMK